MSRANRFARQLTIVSRVMTQPGQTPARLAASVGISERTLFRDLQALRRLGFEVGYQDGYQLQERLDLDGRGAGATLHRIYDSHLELMRTQLPRNFADQVEADMEVRAPAAVASLFAGAIERRLSDGTGRKRAKR